MRVDDFQLSTRASNCLRAERIERLGDLVQRSEQELLEVPNLGAGTLREIKTLLDKMELALSMEVDDLPTPDIFDGLHTIEQQLDAILDSACAHRSDKKIAQLRFGWGCARTHTLAEIGKNPSRSGLGHSVTRERIRQIDSRVRSRIKKTVETSSPPPALLNAIALIQQHAPLHESDMPALLSSANLAAGELDYKWLHRAAKIIDVTWQLARLDVYGGLIVSAEDSAEVEHAKKLIDALNKTIAGRSFLHLSEIENQFPNITSQQKNLLRKVISDSPDYRWLDEAQGVFWNPNQGSSGRDSRIVDICKKVFSAMDECSIDDLLNAISRSIKHRLPNIEQAHKNIPSKLLLIEMLHQTSYFEVRDGQVTKKPEFQFNRLSPTDIKLLRAGKSTGTVFKSADISRNAAQEGMSWNASQLAVTAYSPFFCMVRKGYYRMLVNPDELDFERLASARGD